MSEAHIDCICSRGFDKGYSIPCMLSFIIKSLPSIDFFCLAEACFVIFENKKSYMSEAHIDCICSRGFDKGYSIPCMLSFIIKCLPSIDFFCLTEACFMVSENKKSYMSEAHMDCICSRGFNKGYPIPCM